MMGVFHIEQAALKTKGIQWAWSEVYGEKKFVIMMGGFHIVQAVIRDNWRLACWIMLGQCHRQGWYCILLGCRFFPEGISCE